LRLLFLFFAFLGCCSIAQGDVLWLKNGDRLSGEILFKKEHKILLRSTYAGDLEIKWQEVDHFVTDKPLTFMLRDGNRLVGKAALSEAGEIGVETGAVLKTVLVSLADIVAIHPQDYVDKAAKLSGRLNVGLIGNSGNTETSSLHADGELVARTKNNRYTLGAVFNWGKDGGMETESNLAAYSKYDHFVNENWYLSANAAFLRDRFKDLRLRSRFGVGVGYQVWETEERNLSMEGGVSYVNEDFYSSADSGYPGARWALQFDHFLFDKLTQFFHKHEFNVGMEDVEDLLFSSEIGLRFPLKKNFKATLQYNYDWDNTPAQGKKRNDQAYMLNFGYSW
jgi:putative salt-induced outer membrane protein YdiY